MILSILSTEWAELTDSVTPVSFAAVDRPRTVRVRADTPVYIAIGPGAVATDEDCYVNEFEQNLFNIPGGHDLSVLGTDAGDVWVTEVKVSS